MNGEPPSRNEHQDSPVVPTGHVQLAGTEQTLARSLPPSNDSETITSRLEMRDLTPSIRGLRIECGARGDLWKADWDDEKVVLKPMRVRYRTFPRRQGVEQFLTAVATLTRLTHPNILALYGICSHGPYGFALVLPFLEHGDVMSYLNAWPAASRTPLALDVLRGLTFLHSQNPPIVHGQLRAVCLGD
ncbi:hypothetical protein CALCODRAFT_169062 [Calocera cornea HHB12733]|uniref:Protein kinase domain-containing protein n=1 Tax=Calocera cornea HHB12733 TaxID=1353952 RepID=A0A165CHD2_9BASI|nr:hypothetical protein CALCODRAFT_169062 [Calocera cornea HHB12733]